MRRCRMSSSGRCPANSSPSLTSSRRKSPDCSSPSQSWKTRWTSVYIHVCVHDMTYNVHVHIEEGKLIEMVGPYWRAKRAS